MDRLFVWLAEMGDAAARIPPAQYCQAVFALLAMGVLTVNVLPASARRHLVDYGARESEHSVAGRGRHGRKDEKDEQAKQAKHAVGRHTEPDALERLVATMAAHSQVPHTWFASFYAAYLACTAGWLVQWWLWRQAEPEQESMSSSVSGVFGWLVEHQARQPSSASLVQVALASGLETLQAARRLYEHVAVLQASRSKMNITHWVLGLAFYVCMSLAVWIEGAQALLAARYSRNSHSAETETLKDSMLWAKIVVGTSLFFLAWLEQYRCHAHLASLKKYSLPEKGLFCYIVCPHYTCECALYLSLSIVAAPGGRLFNQTLLTAVFFVVVCLGVTASRTKTWYVGRFGRERLAQKWNMIPFVF